jgi:putative ABC transport system permease protein
MNIMLVSVTERTREIGVLKAIGARQRDIQRQFLVESVAICLVGATFGLAVGIGGIHVSSLFTHLPVVIPAEALVVAFGFSTATGIFFGWYPALRASRLDPIDALRHE